MATNAQLAKIHIAKKELNISDENYRDLLSGWNVQHANELSYGQAEELLKALQSIGFTVKVKRETEVPINIKVPVNRSAEYATQGQINMLAAMWVEHSNQKDEVSFIKFVLRITGINHITWLFKKDVRKVKKAIENLRREK